MKVTYTLTFDFGEMTKDEALNQIGDINFPNECLDALVECNYKIEDEK